MSRTLALDLSSKTGWALYQSTSLSDGKPLQNFTLKDKGLITLGAPILSFPDGYPYNVRRAAQVQAAKVFELVLLHQPDVIVIEDTTPGRQALSQRFLEWLHYAFLSFLDGGLPDTALRPQVFYLRTGVWRHKVGLAQSKADAKNNKVAKKLKELAQTNPELAKRMKKETGVRGKVGKKHYAVRMVNELWGLNFKVKDNDIADAILLGLAFLQGAEHADGT